MKFSRPLCSLRSQMLFVALAAMEVATWSFLDREARRQLSHLDSWSQATIQLIFLNLLIFGPASILVWDIRSRADSGGKKPCE